MTPTQGFVRALGELKPGNLGLLRTHALQGLDESLEGFDIFTGLWWPLREKNQRAPRREVAWLITKLFAFHPLPHEDGHRLSRQLRLAEPRDDQLRQRFRRRFDAMLAQPIRRIEPHLQWALDEIAAPEATLDWVGMTDDLSRWESVSIRQRWTQEYLDAYDNPPVAQCQQGEE